MEKIRLKSILTLLLLSSLILVLSSCAAGNVKSAPGSTTTIILIRHAEKVEKASVNGPFLLPEGRARARALVDVLGDMGVTAIYSPKLGRNIKTVQPLADKLGLTIDVKENLNMFGVDSLANEMLAAHPGGVIVFVGNVSGNLMAMHSYLGGQGKGPVNYGDMAIFTITDRGTENVRFTRFGE